MASQQEFLNQVYQAALDAGLSDAAAKVTAAQAAIESNYGQSAPGNNYFGIKAGPGYSGKSQSLMTTEGAGTAAKRGPRNFRVYDSPQSGMADRIAVMQRAFPDFNQAQTVPDAYAALRNGVYGNPGLYYTGSQKDYENFLTNAIGQINAPPQNDPLTAIQNIAPGAIDTKQLMAYANAAQPAGLSAPPSTTAPTPMPGRPAALNGLAALPSTQTPAAPQQQTVRLASGKMVAPGVYDQPNGTKVSVSNDGNGNAIVKQVLPMGSIPGVLNTNNAQGTVAGPMIDAAKQQAKDKIAQATTAVTDTGKNLGNTAVTAATNLGSNLSGALGAFSGLGSLFNFGGSSSKPATSPNQAGLAALGNPWQSMASAGPMGMPPVTNLGDQSSLQIKPNYTPPTQAYSPQVMQQQVVNPDYLKYIEAQKADPVGAGPGGFADLQSLYAPKASPPPQYITVAKPQTVARLPVSNTPLIPNTGLAALKPMPVGMAALANQNYYQNAFGTPGSAQSGSGGGASQGYLFG